MTSKLVTLRKLRSEVDRLKREKKRIVFTNGCFDLLHPGHVFLLQRAKRLGDVLIVGLNSDSSVRRLKGNGRPLLSEKERAFMLSAIEAVDYVVIFREDTPINLIRALHPDVLVKGADWKKNEIVGREIVEKNGGKVVRIPLLKGFSTTGLLKKIKRNEKAS